MASTEKESLPVVDVEQQQTSSSASQKSLEKATDGSDASPIDLDRVGEKEGYVLDEAQLKAKLGLAANTQLKTAKDGRTVLIPQPTDDRDDPLNWPTWKKSVILAIISVTACTPDYSNATGAVALLPQAA